MPADPQQILVDPNFHALPLGERLKVMRSVDPRFAALPAKEQGTVLYQAASRMNPQPTGENGPEDQGFFGTLLPDLWQAVKPDPMNVIFPPYAAAQQLAGFAKSAYERGGKAVQELKSGDPVGASGYAMTLPFPQGEQMAQAGEELGSGQYGQGAAHLVESVLPAFLPDLPKAGAVLPKGSTLKAVGKGAYEGAKTAPFSPTMATLGEGANLLFGSHSPEAIASVAATGALPKVFGAVKGGINAFRGLDTLPEPPITGATNVPGPPTNIGKSPITRVFEAPGASVASGGIELPPPPPESSVAAQAARRSGPVDTSSLPDIKLSNGPARTKPGMMVDAAADAKDLNFIDTMKAKGISKAQFTAAPMAQKNLWLDEAGQKLGIKHKHWREMHEPSGESITRMLSKWTE